MGEPSAELLDRYRTGDPAAAELIFQRYTERLLALARSRLSPKLARRIDPDDVLQSTYRSFFLRARQGQFELGQPGDLWRLLATITLHKLGRQAQRHQAAKRALRRETAPGDELSAAMIEAAARDPSPADVVAAADELCWLMAQLEPAKRRALELRLQGYTLLETTAQLNCSERTLRRWLAAAYELLQHREQVQAERAERPSGTPTPPIVALAETPLQHADYHLEQLIGSGGMCKAYRAIQKSTGRSVCVKVLRKALRDDRQFLERFLNEARIVAHLVHPRIVPIQGCGRLPGGGYFMVLDYLEGGDVAQSLAKKPSEPRQAARMVADVAEAIQFAHEHGVIHRDLKPSNLLLDQAGEVHVSDFGFAWWEQKPSREDVVVGTASYMAPEQIDARYGAIGPQTDVYGLGGVLFTLLVGRPPAAGGSTSEILEAVVAPRTHLNWPEACGSTVSPELRHICEKCLRQDPRRRFATAQEVAAALHAFLNRL